VTRVRLAVIGLGGISQSVHLPLIQRCHDAVELVAVVDLSASRGDAIADAHGVGPGRYTSVDALVAAVGSGSIEVDGAIVATTGSHAGDVGKLVAAGIRVLAEKPLAYSLAELEQLEVLGRERGIDLADWIRVGYMKEYDPASVAARELLAGVNLRAVTVEVLHPADGAQLAFANLRPAPTDVAPDALAPLLARTAEIVDGAVGELTPALRTLYTNVVLGSVVHDIALLRVLVGGLGEVRSARHWPDVLPGSLRLDGTLAEHDVPWSIDWHFLPEYPEYRETVSFHHDTGTIRLVFSVPYVLNVPTLLEVVDGPGALGARHAVSTWMQHEAFERELRAFAALVRGNGMPGSSVAESADDIRVGQRMIAALAASKDVVLDPAVEAASADLAPLPAAPAAL
jgi:predicted dehydrogenase